MFKIIKSRRINVNGQRFNSYWEYTIYRKIKCILPKEFHPIKVNKKIPGFRIELDIYIPKLKLGLELQGPSHFYNLKVINRDLIKASICKKLNIELAYLYFNKYYGNKFLHNLLVKRKQQTLYHITNNMATTTPPTTPTDFINNLASVEQEDHQPTNKEFDPDNLSEHSLPPLSETDLRTKTKKIKKRRSNSSRKEIQEKLKLYRQEMEQHFDYIKTIKAETYYSISIAIEEFKKQCPEINIQDSSIKRHILKHYKTILDCIKLNNRWMCASERVREIKFDLSRFKKGKIVE